MALLAPAIVDVRPAGPANAVGMTTWLRGIGVRQVRVLYAAAATHASLGLWALYQRRLDPRPAPHEAEPQVA